MSLIKNLCSMSWVLTKRYWNVSLCYVFKTFYFYMHNLIEFMQGQFESRSVFVTQQNSDIYTHICGITPLLPFWGFIKIINLQNLCIIAWNDDVQLTNYINLGLHTAEIHANHYASHLVYGFLLTHGFVKADKSPQLHVWLRYV